jgi:putative heme degradation protein
MSSCHIGDLLTTLIELIESAIITKHEYNVYRNHGRYQNATKPDPTKKLKS